MTPQLEFDEAALKFAVPTTLFPWAVSIKETVPVGAANPGVFKTPATVVLSGNVDPFAWPELIVDNEGYGELWLPIVSAEAAEELDS